MRLKSTDDASEMCIRLLALAAEVAMSYGNTAETFSEMAVEVFQGEVKMKAEERGKGRPQ